MPVAQSQGHAGKALAIAAVAIVLIAVVAVFVALAASRGDVEINLGDDRFNAGQTERLAKEIDDGGGLPFLYQDLVGNDRHLFVQHLGDDPDEGWVAFGAFDPDDPSCAVLIDREDEGPRQRVRRVGHLPARRRGPAPVPDVGRGRPDLRRRQRAHHVDHGRLALRRTGRPAPPSGP